MRHLLLAILVALPTALITFILTRGASCPRTPTLTLEQNSTADNQDQPPVVKPQSALPNTNDPIIAFKAIFTNPFEGFKLKEELVFYDDKGLFDYIDGAAPVYIKNGFVRLAAAEMATSDDHEFTCDVYNMGSNNGAKAIYDTEGSAQTTPVKVGDAGRSAKMSLVFYYKVYYLKLTAFDAQAESKLPALAQILAQRL
ncbi:MAG: hypothetical protein JW841_02070 [Deltaproteobacteria bacterium]|nr:hypothetical protein [Deltaproteobacteria bacterium]